MNCVSPSDYNVIGTRTVSKFDDTVRLAPDYAYYQPNIQTIINKDTVHPDNPKDIFTGSFKFDSSYFADEDGAIAYPAEIESLFEKAKREGQNGE